VDVMNQLKKQHQNQYQMEFKACKIDLLIIFLVFKLNLLFNLNFEIENQEECDKHLKVLDFLSSLETFFLIYLELYYVHLRSWYPSFN